MKLLKLFFVNFINQQTEMGAQIFLITVLLMHRIVFNLF